MKRNTFKDHVRKLLMVVCFVFMAGMTVAGFTRAAFAQEPKKILLVHSYHPEYPWVAAITEGVQKAFEGQNVSLEIFYMDTKRKTSQEWKAEAGRLAREKIDAWQPDAVIVADENAQIFVTQQYAGKPKPFFVFCGLNADPADYGLPASNVTGLVERPHFKASIDYLKQSVPNIKKVAVISDTDPTSIGALDFMQQQSIDVEVLDYHLIKDFNLWKQRVLEYNKKADALCIYMYHTVVQEGDPESMLPKDVMDWTKENATIPTVGFFDFSIEDGMFCGVVESGQEHGFEAAQMALALLNGADIKIFPVKTAARGAKMINLWTAKKLKITVPEEILKTTEKVIK